MAVPVGVTVGTGTVGDVGVLRLGDGVAVGGAGEATAGREGAGTGVTTPEAPCWHPQSETLLHKPRIKIFFINKD